MHIMSFFKNIIKSMNFVKLGYNQTNGIKKH